VAAEVAKPPPGCTLDPTTLIAIGYQEQGCCPAEHQHNELHMLCSAHIPVNGLLQELVDSIEELMIALDFDRNINGKAQYLQLDSSLVGCLGSTELKSVTGGSCSYLFQADTDPRANPAAQ
jgi:hypothetical protein